MDHDGAGAESSTFQVEAEGGKNGSRDQLFLQECRVPIKKSSETRLKRKVKFGGRRLASERVWT